MGPVALENPSQGPPVNCQIRSLSALLFALLIATPAFAQDKLKINPLNEPLGDPGVVPLGANGKPLNLNFENGTIDGWTVEGDAFKGQPIKGDIIELRPAERKRSEHTGQFW